MRRRRYRRASAREDLKWLGVFLLYALSMITFTAILSVCSFVKRVLGR